MSRALARDQRIENDAYFTPDPVAAACLRSYRDCGFGFDRVIGPILEPSVGGGAFVKALRQLRPETHVIGCDVDPGAAGLRLCDESYVRDFMAFDHRAAWVVGNPPFKVAEDHVRHAIGLADFGVGFLLRLAFLEGQKRRAFWEQYNPYLVDVLRKRPSFTGGGTDSAAYAFFVWKAPFHEPRNTILGWIDW